MTIRLVAAILTAAFALCGPVRAAEETLVRTILVAACERPDMSAAAMAELWPGLSVESEQPIGEGDTTYGWSRFFRDEAGGRLELTRFAVMGAERTGATYVRNGRPLLTARTHADCGIADARGLLYAETGEPTAITLLDGALEPTGRTEPINPPVPSGEDPSGVPVAFIDTGVNYLLPEIGGALARDSSGAIAGYDYWDNDERPFDANPIRSPFYPARHGTRVASALLREAPDIRLVVYRYPFSQPARMHDLLADAEGHGARIVMVTVSGSRTGQWEPFATAAGRHPEMLFIVSAGSGDGDIDESPVYPAALALPNMIVVTAADGFGDPLSDSNWGVGTVDLLVPAERIPVTDFGGGSDLASGPEYATARVAALAARLLAGDPALTTEELREAIIGRARMIDAVGALWVGYGLLDPNAHL